MPGVDQSTVGLRVRLPPIAWVGLTLILCWVMIAALAPWVAPYSPTQQDIRAVGDPTPSMRHWLGVDHLRRDELSRLIWGSRTVLTLVPGAMALAYLVGISLGLLAGFVRGFVDDVIMRAFDVLLSFPKLVMYIVLIAAVGASAHNVVLAIVLASAPGVGRLARGLTLELREQEYIAAARTRGEGMWFILARELLPNARRALLADACMRMGYTIIQVGALGFLGLGLPPPTPDWGGMLRDGAPMLSVYPHMALAPAAAICSLVIGFNLLADGLAELRPR